VTVEVIRDVSIKYGSAKIGGRKLRMPQVLTVREVAEYLRVHPTTIYRLMRAKQIPAFRVGSEWRFNVEVIDEWCRGEEQGAASTLGPKRSA
jgi:excisionase family DNA binding protein